MGANLITGNLFSPILASQDSDYQAGVSGDKTLILPVGAKMSLEIEDANTIRANDGVLVTKEGRRIQIDTGAVEEWSIPTGTQGETSYYLIGFHLYTTEESAEICETFIEKVASATDTITENTFKGGATEVYITLGRVTQDGINLDSVEGLIDTADSLTDLGAKITQINADLTWQPYTILDTMTPGNYECPDVNNYRYIYLEMAYSSATKVESKLIPIPRWKAVQIAYALNAYIGSTERFLAARYIDDTHVAIDCSPAALNWIRVMLVNY